MATPPPKFYEYDSCDWSPDSITGPQTEQVEKWHDSDDPENNGDGDLERLKRKAGKKKVVAQRYRVRGVELPENTSEEDAETEWKKVKKKSKASFSARKKKVIRRSAPKGRPSNG